MWVNKLVIAVFRLHNIGRFQKKSVILLEVSVEEQTARVSRGTADYGIIKINLFCSR